MKLPVSDEAKLLIDELIVCSLTCEQHLVVDVAREAAALSTTLELRRECAVICFQAAQQLIQEGIISESLVDRCIACCLGHVEWCRTIECDCPAVQACVDCVDACRHYLRKGKQ